MNRQKRVYGVGSKIGLGRVTTISLSTEAASSGTACLMLIKDSPSVDKFKIMIEKWKGGNCSCKNCRLG